MYNCDCQMTLRPSVCRRLPLSLPLSLPLPLPLSLPQLGPQLMRLLAVLTREVLRLEDRLDLGRYIFGRLVSPHGGTQWVFVSGLGCPKWSS